MSHTKFVLCYNKVEELQVMKWLASNGSFAGDQKIDGSSFMCCAAATGRLSYPTVNSIFFLKSTQRAQTSAK